jgi:mRNA interferase RelE/StbE
MKAIVILPAARRSLRRMPANVAKRILEKIADYAADPASQGNNVTALRGRSGIRLRVGDWRVIMDDGEVLEVVQVGPRGGIYERGTEMGMVTIPRAEYDRLIADSETLADLAAYDAAKAEAGEGMPLAVFSRIISGENPVKVIRKWRGLTQAELARRADLHRVQLHDIETGKSRGSVETLKAIAVALDVPLDDVV